MRDWSIIVVTVIVTVFGMIAYDRGFDAGFTAAADACDPATPGMFDDLIPKD